MAEAKTSSVVMTIGLTSPVEQALETAPVIYIDGAVGFATAREMVTVNLYQDRLTIRPDEEQDQKQGVTRTVCARLVMPRRVAYDFRNWLTTALDGSEAGVAKAKPSIEIKETKPE